jgi:pimeloyl-ACP methyl ester carboxylesterase
MSTTVDHVSDEASLVRPFKVEVSEADLQDLRARVQATRWPDKETVDDQSQGPPLATMQKIAEYWTNGYDWRKCEAQINSHPHYLTEIDGLDIHFIHARSPHEDALPLLVSHGWPGSIVEQLKIIEPLTNPTKFGGQASDAFHVVIPSMPGYGYSGKPTTKGWGPERIGRAWLALMRRLGYERFVATGGDWGGVVVDLMALEGAPELVGIHTNFPGIVPPEIELALATSQPVPANLSPEEQACCDQLRFVFSHVFYAFLFADRPQALTGIADSPIGLAAMMLDHDRDSLALIARSFDGVEEGLSPDDFLDNVSHFWFTNSGVSASRIYAENKVGFFSTKGVTIPVAVSVFPDEIYSAPRSWTEAAYPNLIHYNKVSAGGHFAAWEQPELFSQEVRDGFRSLR